MSTHASNVALSLFSIKVGHIDIGAPLYKQYDDIYLVFVEPHETRTGPMQWRISCLEKKGRNICHVIYYSFTHQRDTYHRVDAVHIAPEVDN
jgi:hypothetical protein